MPDIIAGRQLRASRAVRAIPLYPAQTFSVELLSGRIKHRMVDGTRPAFIYVGTAIDAVGRRRHEPSARCLRN